MSRPKTITEYILNAPKVSQAKLKEMKKIIKSTIPKAKEEIKWGMPTFSYNRILVVFAGYNKHIGFYPTSGPIRKFKLELKKFKTAKGSIQFPIHKPLPKMLIRKIVKYREKEYLELDKKWKNK